MGVDRISRNIVWISITSKLTADFRTIQDQIRVRNMWFIDKLNMHQDHESQLSIVGSERVIRVDIQTLEVLSDSPKSLKHEGSFSSSVTIRCNGTRVQVTGNPSRWNRAENLFGFTSIEECVSVYNHILLTQGLPPFTKATMVQYRQGEDGSKFEVVTNGAVLTHIDVTRNLSVGAGCEVSYLRGLSTQTIGKSKEPYLYPNNMTVDWYKGSTVRYTKIYVKSHDLKAHQKKRLKSASEQEKKDYESVINYCENIGLVREEHSFKSPWLKRKKLNVYGYAGLADIEKYTNELGDAMKRLEVVDTRYEDVAEQLLNANVVKSMQAANATQSVAMRWQFGLSIDKKKRQYYEHKKRLLQIGIDISIPLDTSKSIPQIRSNKVINISPLNPPNWYQMPQVPTLKAVC